MRYRRIQLVLLEIVILLFFSTIVIAQNPVKDPNMESPQGDDIPLLGEGAEKTLDEAQESASRILLDTAEWIDSFFDDKRFKAEENTTTARISLETAYSNVYDFEIKPRFDLRLKLPKLTEKTYLLIGASNDDRDFDFADTPITSKTDSHEDSDNSEITAEWQQVFLAEEGYNFSSHLGASFDYAYAGAYFRYLDRIGEDFQGRFTSRLRYYTDDGWENVTSLDFETLFGDNFFFRTTGVVLLNEIDSGVPHGVLFRLTHKLSDYQALRYEAAVYLETEPSYDMSELRCAVSYRQRFYRDWMFLEVIPIISFPEETDYDMDYGIIFKIEAIIGKDTGEKFYKRIFD